MTDPVDTTRPPNDSGFEARIRRLEAEKADLEATLMTVIEHGDALERQISEANRQLEREIGERRRAEQRLERVLHIVQTQKQDLELVVNTIAEHGDAVDRYWMRQVSEAQAAAELDSLTGLANRRRFDPLGLEADIKAFIETQRVPLNPGDVVVLDTDGITEAEDTAGRHYGLGRLCERVEAHPTDTAQGIHDAVLADLRRHIADARILDDITLLVLKAAPAAEPGALAPPNATA
jgi:GGDEF domain-containing protein